MSYILDALKKAESERNLGAVPGVHATMLDAGSQTDEAPVWRKILPWSLVALMGLALLGYVLWAHEGNKAPVEQATPTLAKAPEAAVTPAAAVSAPPTEQKAPEPQTTPTLPVADKAPAAPANGAPPAAAKAARAEQKAAAQVAADPVAAPKSKAPALPVATPADTPAVTPDNAKSDEQAVGTLQDLPANIQRELPPISVNGYIYARNPADRSVLMNKRLLREGESVAPDLVLEKLLPKGAILNYKGYRYRVAF